MEIFKIIIVILLLVLLGVCIEMIYNQCKDVEQATHLFKNDAKKFIKALFTREEMRHIFEEKLYLDLKNIVKPYSAQGMDIDVFPYFDGKVNAIVIQVFTCKKFELDELSNILELIKIKFRRYLFTHQLDWRNFAYFVTDSNCIKFYICYEELKEDKTNFESKYRELISEKSDINVGYIYDEALDKELLNVD